MHPKSCCLLLLLAAGLATGCVERRFVITSQPMGALVYYQGKPIGTTPCDLPFLYYGVHEFTFVKDGFETKTAQFDISTPWYQWIGVDVVTELLIPYRFKDVQHIHADLQQASKQVPNLVPRSLELRERVKAIQPADPQPPTAPQLPAMQGSPPVGAPPVIPPGPGGPVGPIQPPQILPPQPLP